MQLHDAMPQFAFDFAHAFDDAVPGISQDHPMPINATVSQWATTIADVAKTITMTVAQKQLLDAQVSRARAGLPPLDSSQYGLGVNVGVSPDTRSMLYIMGGIAALAVVYGMKRR